VRSRTFARPHPRGVPVRVRLPGPAGHRHRRPECACDPGPARPHARPPSTRWRPTWSSGARVRYPGRHRFTRRPSGIPYGQGLVKNSYVGGRSSQPSQTIRQRGIRLKLNPLREVIAGQRVVVVDDSIVRGTHAAGRSWRLLRESGAAEVHVRISSPPVAWPCFYGIDFASRAELAARQPVGRGDPGVDRGRLARLHLAGRPHRGDHPARRAGSARPASNGQYPIRWPRRERGKHLLEIAGRARPSRVHDGCPVMTTPRNGSSYRQAGVDIARAITPSS